MINTSPEVHFATTVFSGTEIKGAIVTEQVDPLTITLPIGTMDLQLQSDNADFSMINPAGDYALLKNKQPMSAYLIKTTSEGEITTVEPLFIGLFFLNTWKNVSNTIISFNCVDLIGILDTLTYDGGIWLTPILIGDLLSSILDPINVAYQVDPDLAAVELTGWIPVCKYREAIQQIGLAAGAYITCARQNGFIKFGKSFLTGAVSQGPRCGVFGAGQSYMRQLRWRPGTWEGLAPDIEITVADKGQEQALTLRVLVTGVEVTAHDYVVGTDSKELYNDSLVTGLHKITFIQPMHDLSVTGATITESGANYAIVNSAGGTVLLTGLVYTDTKKVSGIYMSGLGADDKKNVLSIDKATMVNSSNVVDVAQAVYDYYQKRYIQDVKLYAPLAITGNEVLIDTLYNQKIRGTIEQMVLDLANGFTAQAQIVGTVEGE